MASSTEAHIPSSYPIQPHDLHHYSHLFPNTDNESNISLDNALSDKSDSECSTGNESTDSESDRESINSDDAMADQVVRSTSTSPSPHTSTSAIPPPSQPPANGVAIGSTSNDSSQIRRTPTPTAVAPHECDLQMEIIALKAQVKNLEGQVQTMQTDLENAEAHCALALHELGLVNKRLNTKKKKSHARNINARWLTSADGLRECEVQDAARAEKKKKQVEAAARKAAKQADRITRQVVQSSSGFCFSGALSTKAKEDLVDIATQPKLETRGTKADLLKSIRAHFNAHADLKTDS